MLNDIISALPVIGGVAFLTILMYLYYSNERVRKGVKTLLPFLPMVLEMLARRTADKDKVFDKHDLVVLLADVSKRVKDIIDDPTNTTFEDVEEEIFQIVEKELGKYRNAGVQGVPDLSSDAIKQQVKIAFDVAKTLKRLESSQNENTAGDNL